MSSPAPRAGPDRAGRRRRARARLAAAVGVLILVIAGLISALAGGSLPQPPSPGLASAVGGDPFAYVASREAGYVARAIAGNAHPLFVKSPGGALATAARVAAYRGLIDRAVAGTGIPAAVLEGIVFVESAGRPEVIAGADPADAAGLTQILAQTGQSLLGMKIDLGRSRRLTAEIDAVAAGTRRGYLAPLLARRAAIDARFDPARELAATVRYLEYAERQFGRLDLAVESYHMGVGNLRQVLGLYDGGSPVPYAQVYFDSAPDRHGAAFRLLAGFGDDSELYYWRVLGAEAIMTLYRSGRTALTRLASLQSGAGSDELVLQPPDRTPAFADPGALATAFQDRTLVPLPRNAAALGLTIDPAMGHFAAGLSAPPALYRGLRPAALRLLLLIAETVRRLAGGGSLIVHSTVADRAYQRRSGAPYPAASTGWAFQITRRYTSAAQALAFQDVLDRLQSLDQIGWERDGGYIDVTVAGGSPA